MAVELVIKIPEDTYKHIMSMQFYIPGSRSDKSLLEEILKAIRTGTLLPKKHGRLIDADAFIEQESCCGYIEDMDIDYFKQNIPTIIKADKGE